ncbi:MAG: Flp pilus assembly complex ATPase component TadA [Elusimicrobia bacterium]|nr:Flp pilus assembly complex ATPase component TadA [Elusimicrobiota bacterium]
MKSADERLEEDLVKNNLIEAARLEEIKGELARSKSPPPLKQFLINRGIVVEDRILALQAAQMNIPFLSMEGLSPDPALVTMIPEEMAVDKGLIVVEKQDSSLLLAMQNPSDLTTIENIEKLAGCSIRVALASRWAILRKLSEYHDHYKIKVVEKLLKSVKDQGAELSRSIGLDIDLNQLSDQAPVIKTVNLFLLGALLNRASDIHLIPDRKNLQVKYRVDGVLQQNESLPLSVAAAVVSRVKVMCNLDIAERRLPQDGSFHIKIEGRSIDFRVAITPTVFGEKAIMRVLDKGAMMLGLDHLGFGGETLKTFKHIIHKPNGMVLIVGPTGNGKTTTLYSALNALNTGDKNITTVEDPVEYQIEGLTQIQVNPDIDLNFAKVLRSILRQDPDVILVGEVRDLETTEIAIRAALTGHLVFATLHTNNAAGAVVRLMEMGAEPYLIASSLRCAMSQRLVRTICQECKESAPPSPEALAFLARHLPGDLGEAKVSRGKGCRHCFFTGFRGRTVISELLVANEEIRRQIIMKATSPEVHESALKTGMKTVLQDGLEKVVRGVTTLEDVLEVCEDSEADKLPA